MPTLGNTLSATHETFHCPCPCTQNKQNKQNKQTNQHTHFPLAIIHHHNHLPSSTPPSCTPVAAKSQEERPNVSMAAPSVIPSPMSLTLPTSLSPSRQRSSPSQHLASFASYLGHQIFGPSRRRDTPSSLPHSPLHYPPLPSPFPPSPLPSPLPSPTSATYLDKFVRRQSSLPEPLDSSLCLSPLASPSNIAPHPSLRSPRSLLHSIIPSNTTQQLRMDLLLLHECPSRDIVAQSAWNGCSPNNRAQVWRLLLHYEPLHFAQRLPTLTDKRMRYRHYQRALYAPLGEVIFDSHSSACSAEVDECHNEQEQLVEGGQNSQNQQRLSSCGTAPSPVARRQDGLRPIVEYSSLSARTLRQIEMDLPRTHPRVAIFHVPQIRDPMRRILYIFGMLNPNNNYVQGMNELVTPLLVVFLSCRLRSTSDGSIDSFLKREDISDLITTEQLAEVEADTFWAFSSLVSLVEDNFIAEQPGILRRIGRLEQIVRAVEPGLAAHLQRNGNLFFQFSFRWMNCLLMRELPFRLVIKLWDALLGACDGFADLHVYFCAALISRFADQLMTMDFEQCMLFLQHLPTAQWQQDDIDVLLSQATIWRQTLALESLAASSSTGENLSPNLS